ncbi:MAG: mobile mystery protein A [Actinomycetia bacterium]|nr:mobile mystery protein A [Actinomycetes bacterium]MCP4959118.1 mobile mystery protein A [Actinomycetes bacterium]
MMDRSKARAALERDLRRHRDAPTIAPRSGWIRAIRDALGMSTNELARRVGLSKGRISQIERGEHERSLTLNTLERVAAALDCRVEYTLVPHRPLDDMVWEQARAKAAAEIAAVDHTMALEDQRPGAESIRQRIDEAARRYVDKRGLWS